MKTGNSRGGDLEGHGEPEELGPPRGNTLRLLAEHYFGFNAHASKEHDDDA
jgi:hypothetical protein